MGQFQSSPDPKAGRNDTELAEFVQAGEFQSSPDPKAGRNGGILTLDR